MRNHGQKLFAQHFVQFVLLGGQAAFERGDFALALAAFRLQETQRLGHAFFRQDLTGQGVIGAGLFLFKGVADLLQKPVHM